MHLPFYSLPFVYINPSIPAHPDIFPSNYFCFSLGRQQEANSNIWVSGEQMQLSESKQVKSREEIKDMKMLYLSVIAIIFYTATD